MKIISKKYSCLHIIKFKILCHRRVIKPFELNFSLFDFHNLNLFSGFYTPINDDARKIQKLKYYSYKIKSLERILK